MKCDLHVHTIHSGMCTVPVFKRICRESYSQPAELYETLKRRGMDLVTVTDHDSIAAADALRRHADFFLSDSPQAAKALSPAFVSEALTIAPPLAATACSSGVCAVTITSPVFRNLV